MTSRGLTKIQTVLFGAVATPAVIAFLYYLFSALTTPFEVNYGEGTTLYLASNLGQLYKPLEEAPHILSIYPPIYPAVVAAVKEVTGGPFLAGRIVSLCSAITASVLLAVTVAQLRNNEDRTISALIGVLFLLSPIVGFKFGLFARVDMLGIAFGTVAIVWYYRAEGVARTVGVSLALILMLFTKQNLVALPMALVGTEFLERRYRSGLGISILTGVGGLLLLGILVFVTGGAAWMHLVEYNQSISFSIYRSAVRMVRFLALVSPLLVAIAVATWFHVDSFESVPTFPVVYVGIAAPVTAFLLTRSGTSLNHTLELLLAVHLFAGVIVPRLGGKLRNSGVDTRHVVGVLIAAQLLLPAVAAVTVLAPIQPAAGAEVTADAISDVKRPILTSDVGLAVHNDQSLVTNDPLLLTQLARQGIWDDESLATRLSPKEIPCIVLQTQIPENSQRVELPRIYETIRENYEVAAHTGDYWIYASNTRDTTCGV